MNIVFEAQWYLVYCWISAGQIKTSNGPHMAPAHHQEVLVLGTSFSYQNLFPMGFFPDIAEVKRTGINFTDFVQPLTGICGFRPTHRLSTASSWSSQPAAPSSTPPTRSRNTWASTRYHQHTSHTRDSALRGWSSEGGWVGGCPTSSHPLGLRAASAGGSGCEGGSPSLIHQSSSLRALQAQRLKLQARSTWPIYSTALFSFPVGSWEQQASHFLGNRVSQLPSLCQRQDKVVALEGEKIFLKPCAQDQYYFETNNFLKWIFWKRAYRRSCLQIS